MKKNLMAIGLLIAFGAQGEMFGYFSQSKPYWTVEDDDNSYRKTYEAYYGREEGVGYGREQALLGVAGAYAGYQALNWAYNRWFRNEEKHIEGLFDRIKKTAIEIKQSADKVSNKPIQEGKQEARKKAMNKVRLTAHLLEVVVDLYKNNTISDQTLLELSSQVDRTVNKNARVKTLTPTRYNRSLPKPTSSNEKSRDEITEKAKFQKKSNETKPIINATPKTLN